MPSLDFIADDRLREGLESDLTELDACLAAQAHKAVIVLSGSIVEALLVDALLATAPQATDGKDPLKLELADIITAARTAGIITSRTADLCSVVRSYRNLIHPGRVARLEETVDVGNARIARSLVDVIMADVSNRQRQTYGLTAQQLLVKIENDSMVEPILPHLLADLRESERDKLLLRLIPTRYNEIEPTDFDPLAEEHALVRIRLRRCYRLILAGAATDTKKAAAKQFAAMLRTDADTKIHAHGSGFFQAADLEHLDAQSIALVVQHILSRMDDSLNEDVLDMARGLAKYLDESDIVRWLTPGLRGIVSPATDEEYRKDLTAFIDYEYNSMSSQKKERVLARLDELIATFTKRGLPKESSLLADLRYHLELPF